MKIKKIQKKMNDCFFFKKKIRLYGDFNDEDDKNLFVLKKKEKLRTQTKSLYYIIIVY